MPPVRFGVILLFCFAGFAANAQQPLPELHYDAPPNFSHSAIHPPEEL